GTSLIFATRLNLPALRGRGASLPPIYRALVPARATAKPAEAFVDRLSSAPAAERLPLAADAIRGEVAAVLGFESGKDVDLRRTFKELGFDSLTAVELRNRLAGLFGRRLPSTLVFDYPGVEPLAEFLIGELAPAPVTAPVAVRDVAEDDPVVIVGMACRFPGGVTAPEDLWGLVESGSDVLGPFPADRGWAVSDRVGGFIYDAANFDADFFGISPKEAVAMDPEQRILLETSWEALERAGIDPRGLRKSDTGVYLGVSYSAYQRGTSGLDEGSQGFVVTGTSPSVASGRISYFLGLEGPSVSVDTACSSSLVSLHLAAKALRHGECSMALVGGAAIMATPALYGEFDRQSASSSNGRCKAFAEAADGTGWAEGAGTVVLERLSDARANGHRVFAIVRGSAVNSDGASNGLTAPNGPSQQRVIRAALADAGLTVSDVDAVEAHGTGTKLGDPIEAQALLATYGQDRDRPLWLGSIKSNIGHTQAAAGMAGLIKMVESLRRGVLAATLHVDAPSSHVDWSAGDVRLLTEAREWPETGRARRAGVSAFGISGTNSHVILEQAPVEPEPEVSEPTGPVLVPLSARDPQALTKQAAALLPVLTGAADVAGVARFLGTRRARFDHRAVVVGAGRADLVAGLESIAGGELTETVSGVARVRGRTVFVFPGQGSQWAGMATGLLASSPVFAESIRDCEVALASFVDWSLTEVLTGVEGAPGLDRVDVVQPV
ncbi:type I polyketide synthase, partial [Amycolatopsis minnesotensis]|uniref:type I polyketide synthase n=1 Tax=Amycolatopsis minnesotensis TaxID=337894 RepID=UPI0031DB77F0